MMKKMKTLYLHIGTPKTATTALQFFCAENEKVLNTYGYTYPNFGIRYKSIGRCRNGHFLIGGGHGESGKETLEKKDNTIAHCFEQIYELFNQYDNVILSDEGLWRRGIWHEGRIWKKLREEMDKNIFSLKVIVYLRRQDEFLYSRWNQRIKAAVGLASPDYVTTWQELMNHPPQSILNYYEMLNKIADFIGKESIIVRRFDKNHFLYGQTIYEDFLHAIGLEYSEKFHINENVRNISLTKNNTEIKRILNGLPSIDESCNKIFRICLSQNSSHSTEAACNMLSKQELRKFLSHYQEGNRKIAQEYLNMKENLFPFSYQSAEKWTPQNKAMTEDLIRFIGNLAIYLLKERERQKRLLKKHAHAIATLEKKICK